MNSWTDRQTDWWTDAQTHAYRHPQQTQTARCMFQPANMSHILYISDTLSTNIFMASQADVTHENWVGVLQQIDISGGGNPESFLPKAVSFANDKCWGTLSCALIVDPVTQKTNATAVDIAIVNLR